MRAPRSATQRGPLAGDALERGDDGLVVGRGLLLEQRERALRRPGRAIHAVGDQRVVHVADGEDAGLDAHLVGVQPARVAAAVEPLVVVGDQAPDGLREPAELLQQAAAVARVALDGGELVVGQRAGLLQDVERHGELADVVQQAADGEVPAGGRRKLELLADAGGEQSDAAGVLLGREVATLEPDHQRAHARAEVGLLGGDELGRGEVADQRARGAGALDVQRGRDGDEQHGGDLDDVADHEGDASSGPRPAASTA